MPILITVYQRSTLLNQFIFCFVMVCNAWEAFKHNHFVSLLFNASSQNTSFKMFLSQKKIMHWQMEELLGMSGWIRLNNCIIYTMSYSLLLLLSS